MANRRITVVIRASPIGWEMTPHLFRITYEEIRPGVWQKVAGSEEDLGEVKEKT